MFLMQIIVPKWNYHIEVFCHICSQNHCNYDFPYHCEVLVREMRAYTVFFFKHDLKSFGTVHALENALVVVLQGQLVLNRYEIPVGHARMSYVVAKSWNYAT